MPAQNETTLRPPSNAARTLYEVFQNESLPIQDVMRSDVIPTYLG